MLFKMGAEVDPLTDIENRKAQLDIGVTAARVYAGARSEGLTRRDSTRIVVAWFMSFLASNQDDSEEEGAS